MPLRVTLLLLCFATAASEGGWHGAGDVTATDVSARSVAILRTASGARLTITVLAADLVRVRFESTPSEEPDRSWAVVHADWPDPGARMSDSPDSLLISTPRLRVAAAKHPLRLTFRDGAGSWIAADDPSLGMCWDGAGVRVWKTMPRGEQYYGFGEKAGSLQKRDAAMTMWNSDIPAYGADTDPLYHSIPFFYGIRDGKAYGIFFDNPARSFFDMGKESRDRYSFGAEGGDLNYYFFPGPSPREILERLTDLTGRMPLPPRWSLGYQQCRWSYAPESRVREVARTFRSLRIPCDLLYLDIDYMDGYRVFTWNPVAFPDPARLIADLGADGFRVAVIVDPGIKVDSSYGAYRTGLQGDHFVRNADGTVYTGAVWPGTCAFPDFLSASARAWWGEEFRGLVADGVRGFWNDMNEPSVFSVPTKTIDITAVHADDGRKRTHASAHNVYGMEMVRATYEGVRRIMGRERPFLLTRASYAGGQRYAAAWTGDNIASWEHLAMAIPMCLNMSISGAPFVGSDIGGFFGHPSGELFARWLELGVFTPLMRAHSITGERNKEPWEYGDALTAINRETINFRYRMLPYIYTVMAEASRTGIPAMRPLIFEYPADPRFEKTCDEFLFGPDLLVAPVVTPGDTSRVVLLPGGRWADFWTGATHEGGASVTASAPLARIPLYARAGAVIPMQQVVQYTGQAPIGPLTLLAFPTGAEGEHTSSYYEDDGVTFAYETGAYYRRSFVQRTHGGTRSLTITRVEGSYVPARRSLAVRFAGCATPPAGVRLGGHPVRRVERLGGSEAGSCWTYEGATGSVLVTLPDSRDSLSIVLGP